MVMLQNGGNDTTLIVDQTHLFHPTTIQLTQLDFRAFYLDVDNDSKDLLISLMP